MMGKILKRGLLFLAAVYAVLLLLAAGLQRKMIYPGTTLLREGDYTSLNERWRSHERFFSVGREGEGETLQGWFMDRPGKPLIVFYGGNAQNVVDMMDSLSSLGEYAVLTMNYRGYGRSTGQPSERAMVGDALAVLDLIVRESGRSHSDVIVVGQSIGSGVATQVAAARPVRNLVLLVPFDSLQAVAGEKLPFMPMGLILRDTFRSDEFAPRVACPVDIIAAGEDRVIPPAHAKRLAGLFPRLNSYTEYPGLGHNTFFLWPEYASDFTRCCRSGEAALRQGRN